MPSDSTRSRIRTLSGGRKRVRSLEGKHAIPSALVFCDCFECLQAPGTHPATHMPVTGRWVTDGERKAHRMREKIAGVAYLKTAPGESLEAPELQLPQIVNPLLPRPHEPQNEALAKDSRTHIPETRDKLPPPFVDQNLIQSIEGTLSTYLQSIRSADEVTKKMIVVFALPPTPDRTLLVQHLSPEELEGVIRLDPSTPLNTVIIGYQETLQGAKALLKSPECSRVCASSVKARLTSHLLTKAVKAEGACLQRFLLREWIQQEAALHSDVAVNTTKYFLRPFLGHPPFILSCLLFVAILHLLSGMSMEDCHFALGFLRSTFQTRPSTPEEHPNLREGIPQDVRTALRHLDLDPEHVAYVCCPKCSAIYRTDPFNTSSVPERCTQREVDGPPCNAKLKRKRDRNDSHRELPCREFLYRTVSDYIGRLYSRWDLQQYLTRDPTRQQDHIDDAWDIWDSPALRSFCGPDGLPFFPAPSGEGRLIFSLNMDSFNPYGNRQAGKKVSVGAIYMVCLNLPPSLRYELENMYLVGVIPGPHEPSLHQINYLIAPLVDDLIRLWTPGIYLSSTCSHPRGQIIRGAVIPLVCDLPAGRQMAGFAHYTSKHFCSYCALDLDSINNLDFASWRPRNDEIHRRAATGWLNAQTQTERENWMKVYGVRWSELLRLPYWSPIRYTVIDSMHAFYLRLFQHHIRSVWGMDVSFEDGPGVTFDTPRSHPTEDEMAAAHKILRHGSKASLEQLRVAVVRELCLETSTVDHRGKKRLLVDRLLDYRVRQGWFTASGQPISDTSDTNSLSGQDEDVQMEDLTSDPKSRIQNHQDIEDYFSNANKTTIYKLRKEELLAIFRCKVQEDLCLTDAEVEAFTAPELRVAIQKKRRQEGIIDAQDKLMKAPTPKRTRVLGWKVLSQIRADMARIKFPSWMAKAPAHPGEKRWGKFSADQWRTFCLHILPITLVRLWGGMDASTRERWQLDNFMDLVSAVKLATMRKMTPARIQRYHELMHRYLTTLLELYPNTNITPYQHLSLHFAPILEDFGPTQAWRCFPFERYNYVMQQTKTNQKFGELEKTMFMKFCQSQTLRAIMKETVLPQALHDLIGLFRRRYCADDRGTRLTEVLAHDEYFNPLDTTAVKGVSSASLPAHTQKLLQEWVRRNDGVESQVSDWRVQFFPSVQILGQRFSRMSDSPADSHVIYKAGDEAGVPGSIQGLFSHTRALPGGREVTQRFAVIRAYQPISLEDAKTDNYRNYPEIGACRFYNKWADDGKLVPIEDIECHFAACVQREAGTRVEYVLTLPLNKV